MEEKDVKEVEKVLSSLDGIQKAKVVVDELTGEMKEIHVLSLADKNSKQIVRDVETAVLTVTGERIDRRIISVAQMSAPSVSKNKNSKPFLEESITSGKRFRIESVGFSEDEMEIEVNVELSDEEEIREASKRGVRSFKNVLKLSAEATIEAVEKLTNSSMRISLDDVREVSTGERKFFLGVMTVLKSNGLSKELVFAGAVGFNAVRNVAEAVVDEINSMLNF
ncbi:hypothetical protein [Mesoaciditoga sp.]